MKKSFSILILFTILFVSILTVAVNAADLDTIEIKIDKTTVHPDGNVTLLIDYGQELGAATFEIDYDVDLFDYVSATGTTSVSDVSGTVTAIFLDSTGGDNPSTGMTITFKAKSTITTSNPTEFMITATGLANADSSEIFDDILIPIVKDVMAEPDYVDYTIGINHTGTIMPNVEHAIGVTISSTIGRYYDHLRLIAEVTKPDGATVKLMGTDADDLEHDVILSGWGDPAGFGLGGVVNENYNFRGTFSHDGEYTLTLKLIDRDDSDAVIATGTANIRVGEEPKVEEILPEELPKTGMNNYAILSMLLLAIGTAYAVTTRKK